ncbi:PD-(D/E)XK nuclease-like domain-containing protein [Roseibium sp. Sym1]|uniref:PD-(D/E)XK nuclease-like domain-containing protein n=1 Tax=Roseibium sp. Sym1 TaxID=3016006 RepID=UPI0022B56623|nr:PD-(D/E)XK nuclease-like domain-containing protein [Roseibium sp. Sym1]
MFHYPPEILEMIESDPIPGIYFDLPEDCYHRIKALGSTRIKGLVVDPIEEQFDHLYGPDISDNDYIKFGNAIHARMLEGREEFERRFYVSKPLDIPDDALATSDDLKDFIKKNGGSNYSKLKKHELVAAVRSIDAEVPIADEIKARWEKENAGKTELSEKRWTQVQVACAWVQEDPLLSAVMKDGTFVQGAPEVTLIYEEDGIFFKARLDRFLRHAVIDLKTYAPRSKGKLEHLAIKVIDNHQYDLQEAAYQRAWRKCREIFSVFGSACVFGNEPMDGFLSECFDRDRPDWFWIMIKSTGAPQPVVIKWDASIARATAADQVEGAIKTYKKFCAEFGSDEVWIPQREAIHVGDQDLPAYFGVNR